MNLCVLCQKEKATTAEHILKADRYEAFFGNNPALYIRDDSDKQVHVKSKRNKVLKPKKNLCGKCNSSLSQKADRAFSAFDKFIHEEIDSAVADGKTEISVDGTKFFSNGNEMEYLHVIRYFAKHIACQLDRYGHPVPQVLRQIFLTGQGFKNIKVEVTGDGRYVGANIMRNGGIGVLTEGVENEATLTLVKSGVLPEQIHLEVQHGPVLYKVVLHVPEEEVARSAQEALDPQLENALSLLNVPVEERNRIKDLPLEQRAEEATKLMEKYMWTPLEQFGIPKWMITGLVGGAQKYGQMMAFVQNKNHQLRQFGRRILRK